MNTRTAITTLFIKRGILKLLGRKFNRTEEMVAKEYARIWSHPDAWDKDRAVYRQQQLAALVEKINELAPATVLELGAGMGDVLDYLVTRCPSVSRWEGVELTETGVHALQHAPTIYLKQGSMLALPYADDSFDLVFSFDSFEQLPEEYPKAFSEAYRVTRRDAIFVEPFKEAQQDIFRRMHLVNVDYFRASVMSVEQAGFTVSSEKAFPKKSHSDMMVTARKGGKATHP